MNPTPQPRDPRDALERVIHPTLRDLPVRRAPEALQQRVLAEIARRAALPWWRKSFAHWPLSARAVFLVLCVGGAKLALMGSVWVMAGFDAEQFRAAFTSNFTWIENGVAVVQAIAGVFDVIGRNIPAFWFYVGLSFFAVMYATVFGLGAAAYKVIRAAR